MSTTRALASLSPLLWALALGSCVTVNIYFPAAAAEKAADRVIQEVWGPGAAKPEGQPAPAAPPSPAAPPAPPSSGLEGPSGPLLVRFLDLLVPPAAAQADIDVSSPVIRRLTASMQARHRDLEPHYASGAVGLGRDGLVVLRDPAAVPLAARQRVGQLVADENRDRAALYREIASANGHPEWEPEVRATFARRWVANARSGWWHETGSGWAKK
jgi:uncharacterized protein YdbL (DUF1318 family)